MQARQPVLIDIRGQIILHGVIRLGRPRHRHEGKQRPVTDEQHHRQHHLGAEAEVDHDDGGKEIAEGDPLQHTGNANFAYVDMKMWLGHNPVQTEKAVIDQSEQEEKDGPTQDPRVDLVRRNFVLVQFPERERQHHTDDKQKERKNQIVEVKPFPFDVLELIGEVVEWSLHAVGQGSLRCSRERPEQGVAADDPEHIEAA